MDLEITKARNEEIDQVSAILTEAAAWLHSIGQPLWELDELTPNTIAEDVLSGLYYMACLNNEFVGTFKFQLEDKLIWPDVPNRESAFIHRMAVRRRVAGDGIAIQMLNWAKSYARNTGMHFLRLDCEKRPKLCALYERNGFLKHSERQVGPHNVVRFEFNLGNCEQTFTPDSPAH